MGVINKAAGERPRGPSGGASAQERSARTGYQGQPHPRSDHHRDRRVVVGVDGSPNSASAFQRAVSQARQRNATLDVVYVLPEDADARTATMAKVMLGEFTRRQCPCGVGTPVRLRVEHGDPRVVLPLVGAGAELLIIRGRQLSQRVREADSGPRLPADAAPHDVSRPSMRFGPYWRSFLRSR
ncbi:MAG TPA: universal stress protein [Streptosporangiaceae bacterium]|nr:universal stress protein [Streptosporangiaceae bacterium]